jgi:hypothetical protein
MRKDRSLQLSQLKFLHKELIEFVNNKILEKYLHCKDYTDKLYILINYNKIKTFMILRHQR